MTDIIEKLARSLEPFWRHTQNDVIGDAMAEITNLRAANAALKQMVSDKGGLLTALRAERDAAARDMVAFNFSPQFVADVASGRKTQTIRQTSRAKAGDVIQLYTGQRTKACRKLGDAVCIDSMYIGMTANRITLGDASRFPRDMDDFAKADGFEDYAAMWKWFSERYRTNSFTGYITRWRMAPSLTSNEGEST